MVSCLESFGPKMLVISALITDTPTIKGCEPWGGIEVLPAIFSRVVLANFSRTGKLDGLFRGPRSGNLQFQNQKKNRFHPRGIKGCEPQGGIEVIPAIFSRVVLANFSMTGKLDGLFRGPRSGNLQFQNQKKNRFHPRGTRATA